MPESNKILIIGLGHSFRSDDGFGPAVIDRLQSDCPNQFELVKHPGDPADLIECWNQRSVLVIDALQSDQPKPGTLHVLNILADEPYPSQRSLSSHALSLMEALELGRILGKMPSHLLALGAEGENFAPGNQLSPAVAAAVESALLMIPTLTQERTLHA